jgi:D-xylose transport system ATP-binding protein
VHFNARVLIMDEPTAALGPHETAQVGDLIRHLRSEGIGILLVSHDLHDVFALADRVVVFKNGHRVGEAQTAETSHDAVLEMMLAGLPVEAAA